MTHWFRRVGLALGLAGLLVAIPTVALANDTTYTVVGREVLALNGAGICPNSPDLSAFAGQAFAVEEQEFAGNWGAGVLHASLNTIPGQKTEICGGPFVLKLTTGATIAGVFADNKDAIAAGQATCGGTTCTPGAGCLQTFAVSDGLLSVGGSPIGNFGAVLTHFGFWDGSACQTPSLLVLLFNPQLIPTVSGQVAFF